MALLSLIFVVAHESSQGLQRRAAGLSLKVRKSRFSLDVQSLGYLQELLCALANTPGFSQGGSWGAQETSSRGANLKKVRLLQAGHVLLNSWSSACVKRTYQKLKENFSGKAGHAPFRASAAAAAVQCTEHSQEQSFYDKRFDAGKFQQLRSKAKWPSDAADNSDSKLVLLGHLW